MSSRGPPRSAARDAKRKLEEAKTDSECDEHDPDSDYESRRPTARARADEGDELSQGDSDTDTFTDDDDDGSADEDEDAARAARRAKSRARHAALKNLLTQLGLSHDKAARRGFFRAAKIARSLAFTSEKHLISALLMAAGPEFSGGFPMQVIVDYVEDIVKGVVLPTQLVSDAVIPLAATVGNGVTAFLTDLKWSFRLALGLQMCHKMKECLERGPDQFHNMLAVLRGIGLHGGAAASLAHPSITETAEESTVADAERTVRDLNAMDESVRLLAVLSVVAEIDANTSPTFVISTPKACTDFFDETRHVGQREAAHKMGAKLVAVTLVEKKGCSLSKLPAEKATNRVRYMQMPAHAGMRITHRDTRTVLEPTPTLVVDAVCELVASKTSQLGKYVQKMVGEPAYVDKRGRTRVVPRGTFVAVRGHALGDTAPRFLKFGKQKQRSRSAFGCTDISPESWLQVDEHMTESEFRSLLEMPGENYDTGVLEVFVAFALDESKFAALHPSDVRFKEWYNAYNKEEKKQLKTMQKDASGTRVSYFTHSQKQQAAQAARAHANQSEWQKRKAVVEYDADLYPAWHTSRDEIATCLSRGKPLRAHLKGSLDLREPVVQAAKRTREAWAKKAELEALAPGGSAAVEAAQHFAGLAASSQAGQSAAS